MARFDVYEYGGGVPLVMDVQADLLSDLKTRMVVPLLPRSDVEAEILPCLKPVLTINGQDYVMVTTDMAAVPVATLGAQVANLEASNREAITMAVDFLFQGF